MTYQNYTLGPDSNNSARQGSDGRDGLGVTCSIHNTQYYCSPKNPHNSLCHAPAPPSLRLLPSGSSSRPPGDLPPSPVSKIGTLTPSSLLQWLRKACSTVLSWLVSEPLYPKLSTCFEGAQLTQLVQLVTASRLFIGHKGQVDL